MPGYQYLGLIPDGARRWAKKSGVSYESSYKQTMTRLIEVIDLLFRYDVRKLAIYLASTDNITKRETDDVHSFLVEEERFVTNLLPPLCSKWEAEFCICGDTALLPDNLVCHHKSNFEANVPLRVRSVFLLMGYDPWAELQHAFSSNISTEHAKKMLWVPMDIDAVIRTGNHQRLSNFAPMQSAYAELYFIDKLFLDTNDADYEMALNELNMRQRNLGG